MPKAPSAPAGAGPALPPETEFLDDLAASEPTTVRDRMASRARARTDDKTQERPARRQLGADYSYVQKDLRRIVVLATMVIIAIVVLSFFLP